MPYRDKTYAIWTCVVCNKDGWFQLCLEINNRVIYRDRSVPIVIQEFDFEFWKSVVTEI